MRDISRRRLRAYFLSRGSYLAVQMNLALANPSGSLYVGLLLLAGCACPLTATTANASGSTVEEKPLRFEVSFPAKVHPSPVTGRVLVFFCRSWDFKPQPILRFKNLEPVYAIDVTNLCPGAAVVFSPERFRRPDALAFPVTLDELDPGAYYIQALIDLNHTRPGLHYIPGNLYSGVKRIKLAGSTRGTFKLLADKVFADELPLKDTNWVKLVEVRSKLLSDFHGREVMLRAGVILPPTYRDHADRQFPALYVIPPFGGRHTDAWGLMDEEDGRKWQKGQYPLQILRVVLDPETPFGHSVFANSANNGPVGDALVQELIPEIERRFRAVPHGYARFLTGHSSGGWASLWLQVTYPDFFGGCWSTGPDPVDFRRFQTINIYEDKNGYWTSEGYARPLKRSVGKVELTFPQVGLWEYVVGDGFQLGAFNAVFGPRGPDGRPRPLIHPLTGRIDSEVAEHWKRFDLTRLLEENWSSLGPKLTGKLHLIVGASDNYYVDGAVENLRQFLATTDYGGYVEIQPGTHRSILTEELQDRFYREMAERFLDAQKPSSHSKRPSK